MTEPAIDSIAPISRRAIAYLIDALIAGGIAIIGSVILFFMLNSVATSAQSLTALLTATLIGYGVLSLVLLGWLVVYTLMQSRNGSIGMRAQGVRLASADDGEPVGFGRALLRNLVFGVSGWIIVGYFTPLFDSSGRFQGWHDRVANALVLDARKSPLRQAAPAVASTSAPATTALPIAPGIPGIPAPAGAQGGFAAPSEGGFAFSGGPAVQGTPAAPSAHGVPPLPVTPPAHGVPPVPIMPPGPVQPPAFGQPLPAAPGFPSPPVPDLPAPAAVPQQGAFQAPSASPAPSAPQTPQAPAAYAPPAPGANAPVADSSPIAFVPGVTQPGPYVRSPESDGLDPALDETVIEKRTPAQPPAPEAQPAPPAPNAWEQPAAAAPVSSSPATAPATVQAPAAPPSAPVAAAFDAEAEIEATRISVPGHGLVFTWDDGARMTVSRRTVFGRNPAPEDGAVRVAVRDETLSLSKTHFEAAADVSGGWVLDRHSTNGMTIVRDGQRIACPAGQRVPIRLGDAIEIGDRIVTIGGYV